MACCSCNSSNSKGSVLQTYIGENGNWFIGNVDTNVLADKSYFGAVANAQNFTSGQKITWSQLAQSYDDITLSTPETITCKSGHVYNINLGGQLYTQANTNVSISLYNGATQLANVGSGTGGITGGQRVNCSTVYPLVVIGTDATISVIVNTANDAIATNEFFITITEVE